ncbi:MAG: hypothetical protein QXH91_07620 [Candidatus Bathyarchaeia archaeon]
MKQENTRTIWPFIEWTEIVDEENVKEIIVKEEIILGEDVVGNMGEITKVEIFSSLFKPNSLFIKGEKLVGITAENKAREYFYYALFENAHVNERKTLHIRIKGEATEKLIREGGYHSNFAWSSKHIQRIVFPKKCKILSAIPRGYVVSVFKGKPSITWTRNEKFWGAVKVNVLFEEFKINSTSS